MMENQWELNTHHAFNQTTQVNLHSITPKVRVPNLMETKVEAVLNSLLQLKLFLIMLPYRIFFFFDKIYFIKENINCFHHNLNQNAIHFKCRVGRWTLQDKQESSNIDWRGSAKIFDTVSHTRKSVKEVRTSLPQLEKENKTIRIVRKAGPLPKNVNIAMPNIRMHMLTKHTPPLPWVWPIHPMPEALSK